MPLWVFQKLWMVFFTEERICSHLLQLSSVVHFCGVFFAFIRSLASASLWISFWELQNVRLGINSMKWNGSSRPHLSMKPLVSQSSHRFRAHFWNGCRSGLFASPLNWSWKSALQSHWSFAFKPTLLLKKTDEPGKRNVMEPTVCLHKYGENLRFSELASYEVCAFSCSTCQGTYCHMFKNVHSRLPCGHNLCSS